MFIAMNRFRVRPGREEDFENQWKTRDTYLKGVPGFIAFALLRNQPVPGHDAPADHATHGHEAHGQPVHAQGGHEHGAHDQTHEPHAQGSHAAQGQDEHGYTEYVSHTTWLDQAAFDAWRQSDVFRLAHAQGSVEGVLLGPPVVAIYSTVMEEAGEPVTP